MIVEERMYYPAWVGKVPESPEALLRKQRECRLQLKYLPHMVGFYTSDIGPQNMIVHLWGYDDLGHRDRCRAALQADPAWQADLPKVLSLMISQETRIRNALHFSWIV